MMSKINLETISIKSPCNEDWEKMKGDEKTRFCGVCEKDVYNLSAMPEKEANRLLAKKGSMICVRYMRDSSGRIINMPSAAPARLVNISRTSVAAAGIVAAAIAFSDAAHAQEKPLRPKIGRVQKPAKTSFTIKGTIIDSNNEPIANAEVRLLVYDSEKGEDKVFRSVRTNIDGKYELKHIPKGVYTLNVFVESKGRNEQLWKTVYPTKDEVIDLRYVRADPKMTEMGEIAPDITKPKT